MAEENITEATEKQFAIQKLFIKDVSFETPNSPMIFLDKWEPEVEFNLSSNVTTLKDDMYDVTIVATVTVKVGEKTAYLAEVNQSGIFLVKGFNEQEKGPMLGSYCPNVLFPYAREAISDLVTKGGFPPMLLAPVNFDALYQQHIQKAQESQAQSSDSIN